MFTNLGGVFFKLPYNVWFLFLPDSFLKTVSSQPQNSHVIITAAKTTKMRLGANESERAFNKDGLCPTLSSRPPPLLLLPVRSQTLSLALRKVRLHLSGRVLMKWVRSPL